MGITLEPVVFQARKGDKHEKYGDPFDTSCMLIKVDEDTLLIKGLNGKMNMSDYKEFLEKIAEYGFTEITYKRMKKKS